MFNIYIGDIKYSVGADCFILSPGTGHDINCNVCNSRCLGKPYSPNNPSALKRAFGTARKKANINDLRFHDLRHTAATRMIENTGNIVAVSKILGHASIKTTMRYVHPNQSLIEAVESLNQTFLERDGHKSGHI